eukprot:jgi/Mesen1/8107/ME000435S07290
MSAGVLLPAALVEGEKKNDSIKYSTGIFSTYDNLHELIAEEESGWQVHSRHRSSLQALGGSRSSSASARQQAGAELVVGCPSLYSVHHEQPHGAVRYLLIYYFQVAPSQPPAAPALPAHQASPLFKKETIPAASSPHPSEPSDLSPKSPHAPAEDDMWRSGLHRIQL